MFRWSDWIKNIPESMEDTMDIIRAIEQEQLKTDLPAFGPGDTFTVPQGPKACKSVLSCPCSIALMIAIVSSINSGVFFMHSYNRSIR